MDESASLHGRLVQLACRMFALDGLAPDPGWGSRHAQTAIHRRDHLPCVDLPVAADGDVYSGPEPDGLQIGAMGPKSMAMYRAAWWNGPRCKRS